MDGVVDEDTVTDVSKWTVEETDRLDWYKAHPVDKENPSAIHPVTIWCPNCWADWKKKPVSGPPPVSAHAAILPHKGTVEIVCMTCGKLVVRITTEDWVT